MRSLFDDIEERKPTNDASIIQKVKSKKAVTTAKRGGNGLLGNIKRIIEFVDEHLGQYKEETLIIRDEETLENYISACVKNQVVAIDTETTGLNPLVDSIVGVCLYTPEEKTAYIPLEHINYITLQKEPNQLTRETVGKHLQKLVGCKVVEEHNAKFDTRFLRKDCGVNIVCTHDTYLASMLMDENDSTHALKPTHQKYVLNGEGDAFKFDELFKGVDFRYVPIRIASLYAAHDPKITHELAEWQREHMDKDSKYVFDTIEMPCVQVLADMEDTGIMFDPKYADELKDKYDDLELEALQTFYEVLEPYEDKISKARAKGAKIDDPINIGSPSQLAVLLYDILGVTPPDPKNPRGTGVEQLSAMDNPVATSVLEYRGVEKLLSTYIDKLPECTLDDGRIHCNFNQYGAKTGRMSSSDPNLQNIPSHNKDIRKMFVASDGYLLMSSDYSQQEPSCLASFCKSMGYTTLFDARFKGNDLYSEVAGACFKLSYEECCEFDADGHKNPPEFKARRNRAKPVLLGILYSRGDASVAEGMGINLDEAKQLKVNLFERFPEIDIFEKESLAMAKEKGYVTTVCGRKRRLPDLMLPEYEFKWVDGVSPYEDPLDFDHDTSDLPVPESIKEKWLKALKRCKPSEKRKVFEKANKEDGVWIIDNGGKIADATRQCVNARIQGSAADLTKIAMIELHKNEELKRLGFRMLVPVHDEIIAECPQENIKRCSELLAKVMSDAAQKILGMPFKCDVEISREWYGETVEVA